MRYSRRLNLADVTARGSLSSTKFCLAQTPAVGAEYLVYAPDGGPFTVDLSAMPNARRLAVESVRSATRETVVQGPIAAGNPACSFQASASPRRCGALPGGHGGAQVTVRRRTACDGAQPADSPTRSSHLEEPRPGS